MPLIHGNLFYIILSPFLLLPAVIGFLLIKRTRLPRALIISVAVLVACAGSVFIGGPISSEVSRRAQAQIAQPYIQKSLDDQCGENQVIADTDGFYFEIGWKGTAESNVGSFGEIPAWRSQSPPAECIYAGADEPWTCTCP